MVCFMRCSKKPALNDNDLDSGGPNLRTKRNFYNPIKNWLYFSLLTMIKS
jgi:hypothetical protein